MTVKAVLFDMDGVIFDSERAVVDSWVVVADEEGIPDIESFCVKALGINAAATRELWFSIYGDKYPYDEFNQRRRDIFRERFDAGLVAIKPGVIELLKYLKENGIKTAVASSTSSASVIHEIKAAGLYDYFDEIVCGDMIEHSKPAPDIWLKAMDLLGVRPADSAAIEDSFNGVKSAKAAGLYTFMVPDMVEPDDEMRSLADIILPSLNEVLDTLRGE